MKRFIIILIAVLNLILPVNGAEYDYSADTTEELYPIAEMDRLFASLPDEVKSEISDYLLAESDSERADVLSEKLDIGYWISYIWRIAVELLLPSASLCTSLLFIILLSKIALNTALLTDGTVSSGILSLIVTLVSSVSIMEAAVSAVNTASSFVRSLCSMMTAMLPVMEAVMLSSGSVSSAAVNGTSLMIYITLTENFINLFLIPLAGVLLALVCSAVFFGSINISSFVSAVRRVLMTVIGFFLLIFSFVLGIQNSLAKGADSLTLKSVRFAVGSYIPIVGGALSEALTTVKAGLSLVRSTVGGIGIVIILVIVLPPLISLFFTRVSFLLCKSVSDLLDCTEISRVIGEADSVISVFLAFGVMSALFFIFAVILFMNSGLV